MDHPKISLSEGILKSCFEKVRNNFYHKIDAARHADVYVGTHERPYAEPEFTGKFLDLCAYYYETEKNPSALQKGMAVVESIRRNQRADGYLGCLQEGLELVAFSVWNHGFTLYGLIRMYEATKDPDILELARRGGDWILSVYKNVRDPDILEASNAGSQNISCLYAFGRLYSVTRDIRYLRFIEDVLSYCETTDMNLLSFRSIFDLRSKKGIEMLVIYLGVLQFGLMTNRADAVDAARRYWSEIWETQIRNTGNGTVEEKWTPNGNAPRLMPTEEKPNETCVAVGWTELSLALFHADPRAEYLDAVEKTIFNHMIGSLEKSGEDLAYYQGNFGRKIYRTDEGAYQCCRYRGFTLFTYLKDYLYHYGENCVTPLVYCPSTFEAEGLTLRQSTAYPANGEIFFEASNRPGHPLTLRLRIPAWCNDFLLQCNGETVKIAPDKGFVDLPLGEGICEILLRLKMTLSSERTTIDGKSYLSFRYGPCCLAHDSHYGAPIGTPVSSDAIARKLPADGLSLVRFAYDDIDLVDFASAGGNAPTEDEYTVFIPEK